MALAAAWGHAQEWQDIVFTSSTVGNNVNRLCMGVPDDKRPSDIGCPSYAPSLSTAGHVSITGNVSAGKFIGDGSALTGIGQGDRIVSGTSHVVVAEDGSVTITTAGGQRLVVGTGSGPALDVAGSVNVPNGATLGAPAARIEYTAGGLFNFLMSGTNRVQIGNAYVSVNNAGMYRWSTSAQGNGGADVGLGRGGSGYVAVTDGYTLTNYRDLWAREISATNLWLSGTVSGTYGYFRYISGTNIHGTFTGDGSGLTGVIAGATDRIVSGTNNATRMVAISETGFISLTQAGANSGWFDPYRGLVTLGVSSTGGISGTTGYFSRDVAIRKLVPLATLDVNGTISASDAIQVGTSTLTCGAGIPGAIRYNAGSLQYCDGVSWSTLSAGGVADWYGLTNIPAQVVAVSDGTAIQMAGISATVVNGHFISGTQGYFPAASIAALSAGTVGADSVSASLVSATHVSATLVDATGNGTVSGTYGYFHYISGTGIHGTFTGDGSGLTGVIAGATDRIVSGTNASTRMVAVSETGYISITQAGANSGWFSPYSGLVTLGVSSTGPISGTRGYFGGNVGIGNAAPLAMLDVAGSISASGAIQVGTSTLTCGAGIPGAIRYNAGSLQYCDGASWVTLSAGGVADWYGLTNIPAQVVAVSDGTAIQMAGISATVVNGHFISGTQGYFPAASIAALSAGTVGADSVSASLVSATHVSATLVDATGNGIVSATYGHFQYLSATHLSGDGSGLFNVPATAVTGLNLDRISSGTTAAIVNDGTGYVSLTTGGGTWGYLSSGWSYLANLFANTVSSSAVSATHVSATLVDATRNGTVSGTYGYFRYISGTDIHGTFTGDGSGLTGVIAGATDRIVSGTNASTRMVAISETGFISLTQAGANSGWFDPYRGLVTLGVSATGAVSATNGYFGGLVGIGMLPGDARLNVGGTISASDAIQVGTSSLACASGISGSIRYNTTSDTLQVCTGSGWKSLISGTVEAGASALASLTDVTLTNLAGRDYLRYDFGTSKWVNISESAVMSTTTMAAGFPDAIRCETTGGWFYLYNSASNSSGAEVQYNGVHETVDARLRFNASTGAYVGNTGLTGFDCISKSIATLYAEGKAFNFIGNSGASGGNAALGDRITSGTLAMVANSDTSYISLSTAGTDWGYLSSGASYLPNLRSNSISASLVSATNVSATYLQLNSPTTVLACGAGLEGSMRYTSGTMQVCDGNEWGNIGIGVPTGTIAAFAASSCPNGWSEYTPARGRFLRGIDNGAGNDPDGTRSPGNAQGDAAPNITGSISGGAARPFILAATGAFSPVGSLIAAGPDATSANRYQGANFSASDSNAKYGAANEIRPKNVAVTFCMYSGFQSAPGQTILTTLASLTDVSVAGVQAGQVLAFDGASWVASDTTGGGISEGDRITSGTHAVTVNTSSGYVSLSTGGTDWGYLGSGNSYLPNLRSNSISATLVSATNISGTLIQVGGGNGVACDAERRGAIRYSNISSTVEYCNSTAWVSMGPSDTTPISFRVHKNGTNQTVSAATWTKMTWSTEEFDTNNNFASSTFTPTVPGKYLLTGGIRCAGSTACVPAIYKNGNEHTTGTYMVGSSGSIRSMVVTIVDMNGTGDYVDLYGHNTGGTTIYGTAADTYFQGVLLSPQDGGGGGGSANAAGSAGAVQFNAGGTTFGADTNNLYWDDTAKRLGIGLSTPVATLDINGTISASNAIQVGSSSLACNNGLAGAIRYASSTIQVCDGSAWGSLAGTPALASLTDVAITNVAGRDYLRYDAVSSKWVNISESTVMSTTTMKSGWPDAIQCYGATGSAWLKLSYATEANVVYVAGFTGTAATDNFRVGFDGSGTWMHVGNTAGWSGYYETNCNSAATTISSLYASGRAFNFIGNSGVSGGSALGDRITSGTLAMVANSDTSYISLSTAGTDWGYLSSANSYLPRLSTVSVSGTYLQLTSPSANITCNNGISGTLRYASGTVQVCNGTAWGSIAGAAALASLTDVAITNVAGRDYLRYDSVSSKWVNISESTVMSTSTMVPGIPDAIMCNVTNPNWGPTIFPLLMAPSSSNGYQYTISLSGTNYHVRFNPSTGAFVEYGGGLVATSDCGTSISALYAAGKAFNFIGNSGAESSALGDRITSGTLAMVANSDTSYISLSTAGTDWGYLSSANSYLPRLSTVSVSGTYLQLTSPTANITCNNGISGTLRYASGTMQVCNGSAWGSIAGAAALASLTDVTLTNLAGRDYLRYDSVSGKWVNISESTVMSTTTMVNGWPDAIMCDVSGEGERTFIANVMPYTDGRYHYRQHTLGISVVFNANGSWYSGAYGTCNTASISSLYAAGRAFNFIGNANVSSDALGDRITSGTLAMVANSVTSIVSLSSNGTTWGYIGNGGTYLPNLLTVGGDISATGGVSVTGNVQAQEYLHHSDRRLKEDIKGIPNAAEILSKLRGTHFKWKSNGQLSYGLIAQEVEQVLPELVPAGRGMKSIAYDQLTPILIEGWKIHQKSIEGLVGATSATKESVRVLQETNDGLRRWNLQLREELDGVRWANESLREKLEVLKAANDNLRAEMNELGRDMKALKEAVGQ